MTTVLKVVETISSVWYYHLRAESNRKGIQSSICGRKDIMPTGVPVSAYGFKSDHLNEKYCKDCADGALRLWSVGQVDLSEEEQNALSKV